MGLAGLPPDVKPGRSEDNIPAGGERFVLNSLFALAATLVSTFLAWFSHDWLGYSWSDIREAALIGAALVGSGYASVIWRKASK